MNASANDFPITPPMIVKDTPQPLWLMTVEEARDYINDAMRLGRPRFAAAERWLMQLCREHGRP
jgi:hypothetical protein